MNHVRQAFGEEADLYDVLKLSRDDAENPAKLRKAYFRQALVYHPDKTKDASATEKFQAISFAYEVLKNPEKRAEYNDTGHIDEDDYGDDDEENMTRKKWKDYFTTIFGKLTTSKIDQFALKYKCSEEEQRDVLQEYKKCKGNLAKMMEFVILSEPVDAKRWLEDYIQPAIDRKEIPDYSDSLQKSWKKLEKKIEKEEQKQQQKQAPTKKKNPKSSKKENNKPSSDTEDDEEAADDDEAEEMDDSEVTETESEEDISPPPKKKQAKTTPSNKKKVSATKAKPTKAKKKKKKDDDLVAMIQGRRSAASAFADIGARYGVKIEDDPLGDEEFEKIQAKMFQKKKKAH